MHPEIEANHILDTIYTMQDLKGTKLVPHRDRVTEVGFKNLRTWQGGWRKKLYYK